MVACLAVSAGGFWRKHPPATNSPSRVLEKRDIGRDFRVSGGSFCARWERESTAEYEVIYRRTIGTA